jgi:hypothetical protein
MKGEEYVDQLSEYKLLEKGSAPCSLFLCMCVFIPEQCFQTTFSPKTILIEII